MNLERCAQEPRNAGSLEKLETAEPIERTHLQYQPHKTHFRLLASRTVTPYIKSLHL